MYALCVDVPVAALKEMVETNRSDWLEIFAHNEANFPQKMLSLKYMLGKKCSEQKVSLVLCNGFNNLDILADIFGNVDLYVEYDMLPRSLDLYLNKMSGNFCRFCS